MSAGEIIENHVYPFLDAVEVGLLDDLNPGTPGARNTYSLDCPECKEKKRAYYWPTGAIVCNRIESCGYTGSIWSYLTQHKHLSNKECFDTLCRSVNFDPRSVQSDTSQKAPIGRLFQNVLREFAKQNQPIIQAFSKERQFTADQMSELNYGYYPDPNLVRAALLKAGANISEAAEAGYIPFENTSSKNNSIFMAGRIIGFWKEPAGKIGYWGYALKKNRTDNKKSLTSKKYLFNSGGSKNLPYSFRPINFKSTVFVEGMLDSDSLTLLGFASACTGFNKITESQAEELSRKGVGHCKFLTDGDYAGFTGAVSTVLNCSMNDIRCDIALIPTTLDDADKLRADKEYRLISELIDTSYPPGVFLALAWIYSSNHADGDKHNIKELINSRIGGAPSWIKVPFFRELESHGYNDVDKESTERLLAELIRGQRKVIIIDSKE